MKRFLTFALMIFAVLWALAGCGCDRGENADLVFVNDSDATITAVVLDFEDQTSGTQHADSSPLKRGETFGFESGEYPVTVMVYDGSVEGWQRKLGCVTIGEAPADGERWYVTARDGMNGLVLTADTRRPAGEERDGLW